MKRREFITLLGGAAAWPLLVHAQEPKLPRIGVLIPANPEPLWSVFREGLRERGYVEGQTIQLSGPAMGPRHCRRTETAS